MELRQLEHFLSVADEGSFTRAARRANIVPSGLSMSIRALERELGDQLFVRGPKRVVLTTAGRAFLPEARQVIAAVRGAADAVAQTRGLLRGTLVVGSAPALPAAFDLPTLLGRFQRAYPKVRIEVHEDSAAVLGRDVRSGAVDVAFIATAGSLAPRGMATHSLARSPMMFVCSTSHPLAKRRQVGVDELASERFIDFNPDWTIRQIVDLIFSEAGIDRDTAVVVNDVSFLLGFVAQGLGVALVPKVIARYPAEVRYVRLGTPVPSWQLVVAHVKDRPPCAAVRALCALIAEAETSERAPHAALTERAVVTKERPARGEQPRVGEPRVRAAE